MATSRSAPKRVFGEERYREDPVNCECNNVCSRVTGRGACPCKTNGRTCSRFCSCGTKKLSCTNRKSRKKKSNIESSSATSTTSTTSSGNNTPVLSFIDEDTAPYEADVATQRPTAEQPEEAREVPPAQQPEEMGEVPTAEQSEDDEPSENQQEFPEEPDHEDGQPAPVQYQDIQAFVNSQGVEELRQLCNTLLQRHPEDWFDLVGEPGRPDPDLEWCRCGNCRDMPTDTERVCCRRTVGRCVTADPHFHTLILDNDALDLAMAQRYDLLVLGDRPNNTNYRFQAYKSYIYWKEGRTGRYNRRVVPSCAVWKIRDKFPSEDHHYTGFRFARF